MRREINNDMRVQKTLHNIRAAFRKLVLEKNYDELTVSALCSEACIGRKTFYMYYASMDNLLEEIMEQMTKDYILRIKNYKVPDDVREITREFYLYSIEQGKFYENLVCSSHYHVIGSKLLNEFVRETWQDSIWFQKLGKDAQNMLLCFIYNTGAGLYRQWVADGKRIPLDKMIAFADQLLSRGIDGFGKLAHAT